MGFQSPYVSFNLAISRSFSWRCATSPFDCNTASNSPNMSIIPDPGNVRVPLFVISASLLSMRAVVSSAQDFNAFWVALSSLSSSSISSSSISPDFGVCSAAAHNRDAPRQTLKRPYVTSRALRTTSSWFGHLSSWPTVTTSQIDRARGEKYDSAKASRVWITRVRFSGLLSRV